MKLFLFVAIVPLLLLLLLYFFQNSLIYFPSQSIHSPSEAGVPEMNEISLETEDGLKLRAWFRPPQEGKPTIVYFHGNAGNISNRGFIVRPFLDQGYGVLLTTYRGYSGNPGTPSEEGLYADARAAMRFVDDYDRIILMGTSIGAAVAVQMATEFQVSALVLQSPFSSIQDMVRTHYPFLIPFQSFIEAKYDSYSKAKEIDVPVLILHGEQDHIVPPEQSQKLLEEFNGPKERVTFPGKGHNDLFEPGTIIQFIQK